MWLYVERPETAQVKGWSNFPMDGKEDKIDPKRARWRLSARIRPI
jgi:hypothetical protein